MKVFGIILIVVGILMIAFRGINFQEEKNLAKIGPVEINKKENKHIGWPTYAGAIVTVLGIGLIIADRKK